MVKWVSSHFQDRQWEASIQSWTLFVLILTANMIPHGCTTVLYCIPSLTLTNLSLLSHNTILLLLSLPGPNHLVLLSKAKLLYGLLVDRPHRPSSTQEVGRRASRIYLSDDELDGINAEQLLRHMDAAISSCCLESMEAQKWGAHCLNRVTAIPELSEM